MKKTKQKKELITLELNSFALLFFFYRKLSMKTAIKLLGHKENYMFLNFYISTILLTFIFVISLNTNKKRILLQKDKDRDILAIINNNNKKNSNTGQPKKIFFFSLTRTK